LRTTGRGRNGFLSGDFEPQMPADISAGIGFSGRVSTTKAQRHKDLGQLGIQRPEARMPNCSPGVIIHRLRSRPECRPARSHGGHRHTSRRVEGSRPQFAPRPVLAVPLISSRLPPGRSRLGRVKALLKAPSRARQKARYRASQIAHSRAHSKAHSIARSKASVGASRIALRIAQVKAQDIASHIAPLRAPRKALVKALLNAELKAHLRASFRASS